MLLRLILIGMVGLLGLDLDLNWDWCGGPWASGTYVRSCSTRCENQPTVADSLPAPSGPVNDAMPTGLDAFAADPEPPAAVPGTLAQADAAPSGAEVTDAAFEALVDEMVASFQLDNTIASIPLDKNGPTPAAEEPAVFSLAEVFGSDAEVVAEIVPAETPMPEPVAVPVEAQPSRLETALSLTSQAVHAWLSLLQAPALAYDSEAVEFSR